MHTGLLCLPLLAVAFPACRTPCLYALVSGRIGIQKVLRVEKSLSARAPRRTGSDKESPTGVDINRYNSPNGVPGYHSVKLWSKY